MAAVLAVLNAIVPPLLAALRLPFTLVTGFLVVLIADALMLLGAAEVTDASCGSTTSGGPCSPHSSSRR